MLAPGTIIIFDELINYHGWEEGEFKAFMEFAAERKLAVRVCRLQPHRRRRWRSASCDAASKHAVVIEAA